MRNEKIRKAMKRLAASLLVLCLIFTTVGSGAFS